MSHPMRALGRSVLLATGASGLILSPTHALSQSSPDPALVLDPIRVQSDQEGTDTAATSAADAADLQTRYSGNPQTALNALPGVSTRQSSNQPGIEVNIRGLSGFGRVNAMIDGVPQSFKNTASHESSGAACSMFSPNSSPRSRSSAGPFRGPPATAPWPGPRTSAPCRWMTSCWRGGPKAA